MTPTKQENKIDRDNNNTNNFEIKTNIGRTSLLPSTNKTSSISTSPTTFMNNNTHNGGSPSMILSSLYSYIKSPFMIELGICVSLFFVGWKTPSLILSLNERDIPFQMLSNNVDVVLDLSLNNPVTRDVTFPSVLLIGVSIWLPMIIIICIGYFLNPMSTQQQKYSVSHDVHSGICVLLVALGFSEFITQILKLYIGRLRPNFYSLCDFENGLRECTASEEHIQEARMSFPSGHSSLSFCGLGVLCFYLLGRFGVFSISSNTYITHSSLWKRRCLTFFCCTPLMLSTYVAASRVVDNWHHPSDVLAGIAVGLFCSFGTYHMWYSFLFSPMSGIPLCNL